MQGIVRPCESSPQKQKQLWVRTHSEERLASTHTPQHTTTITSSTTPAEKKKEKSFGCSLAARGATLDTYHVRQVLLLGFLFFKNIPTISLFLSLLPSAKSSPFTLHPSSLARHFFLLSFSFSVHLLSPAFTNTKNILYLPALKWIHSLWQWPSRWWIWAGQALFSSWHQGHWWSNLVAHWVGEFESSWHIGLGFIHAVCHFCSLFLSLCLSFFFIHLANHDLSSSLIRILKCMLSWTPSFFSQCVTTYRDFWRITSSSGLYAVIYNIIQFSRARL